MAPAILIKIVCDGESNMKYKRVIIFCLVLGVGFIYGYAFSAYKIFPFKQLLQTKHYLETEYGFFAEEIVVKKEETGVVDTFLERLLIKKVHLDSDIIHGGGISNVDSIIYVVTNKGKVLIFDQETHKPLDVHIDKVPMNFDELVLSGQPYEGDFRINWFRVNGIFAEKSNDGTQTLYAAHDAYDEERDCITNNISKIELTIDSTLVRSSGAWNTIFTASPCIEINPEHWLSGAPYAGHISGGKMISYNESQLLVSLGDYDRHGLNGTEEFAQDRSVPFGKFILVNKDTGAWQIFTMGNRNPQGLYRDKEGTIWSTEQGPMGGDEFNIIKEGENYGWPRVSLGLWYDYEYALKGEEERGRHSGYRKPIFSWVPSIAPNNLVRIEGDKFKVWKGDFILGSLRDQSLHRLRLDENNRVIYNERIPLGHRIRDLTVLANDALALITDDGYLIILEDGGPVFKEMNAEAQERYAELDEFDNFYSEKLAKQKTFTKASGRDIFMQSCSSCHNTSPINSIGPHLNNLFGRKVGEVNDFNFSSVLDHDSRRWDTQLLESFLKNPESVLPGNKMPKVELTAAEVDSLIQYLSH